MVKKMATKVRVLPKENSITWPALCACCCEPATTSLEIKHTHVRGISDVTEFWNVPYCQACIQHNLYKLFFKGLLWYLLKVIFITSLVGVFFLILAGTMGNIYGAIVGTVATVCFGVGMVVRWRLKVNAKAKAGMKPQCCADNHAVTYLGGNSSAGRYYLEFDFLSDFYGQEFCKVNEVLPSENIK